MKKKLPILVAVVVLLCSPALPAGQAAEPQSSDSPSYVYVAPNVLEIDANKIFSSFTLTNTTPFWFNPRVYLVDLDGEIVRQFSPMLKGFGTWQKATIDLLETDFQGSIWILSPQPIVASAFIYQYEPKSGGLTLLGNGKLDQVAPEAAADALKLLLQR